MYEKTPKRPMQVFVAVTYLVMVTLNALANILPINGITTGDQSDFYGNLFAPAGITFTIWGVIYVLLAAYVLYQFGVFQGGANGNKGRVMGKIGLFFALSSVANSLWVLAWHYDYILVSLILIVIVLICLIRINYLTKDEDFNLKEKFFIRLPFSIYFGWVTVATIANVTTLLVAIGWNGFGISESLWTVFILGVGAAIGILTMFSFRDMAYGLVLIWAYAGIYIKHTSVEGFNGEFRSVIMTVIITLVLFVMAEGYLLFSKKKSF